MAKSTLVVKVPVRIVEADPALRRIKYRALRAMAREALFLGNMAIRYAIAFDMEGIPRGSDEKQDAPVPLDTRIYRILAAKRKLLPAATVASLERNYAVKMYRNSNRDAWAGRKSLPTFRSPFLPFRHQGTTIEEIGDGRERRFVIRPSGFATVLRDEVLKEVSHEAPVVADADRGIVFESCFSWKDQGAADIVSRIAAGEYGLGDSQVVLKGRDLFLLLVYKFDRARRTLDPGRVCGVDLGVITPAVCALNDGPQRAFLGDGRDVWAARSMFRAQRRRQQRRQGLISKSVRWERSERETNWIRTY